MTTDSRPHLAILGTRGIPAAHNGFEPFAQRLALHLLAGGWRVTVYCQEDSDGRGDEYEEAIIEDEWEGIRRIRIPSGPDTPKATVRFDWNSIGHALHDRPDVALTLGYNTAIFCVRLRWAGIPNVIAMEGLQWKRAKWRWPARAFLWINERAAGMIADRLVVDQPTTALYLARHASADRISTIPSGSDALQDVPDTLVRRYGLVPRRFLVMMSRPEPDNSVLEVVRAFSAVPRGIELALVGPYDLAHNAYHQAVMAAASPEVHFLVGGYDAELNAAMHAHCLLYVHGNRLGGMSQQLVDALSAGSPVLAFQNRHNYWVCGTAAEYFNDTESCRVALDELLSDPTRLREMSAAGRQRHWLEFRWERVLQRYEQLLFRQIRRVGVEPPARYAESVSGLRWQDLEAQSGSAFASPSSNGHFE